MLESMALRPSPSVPSSRMGMEASISLRPSALQLTRPTCRPLTPSKHLPPHNFAAISCPGLVSAENRWGNVLVEAWAMQTVLATAPRSIVTSTLLTASKYTTYAALSSLKWRVWEKEF
ncbi:hypothetical protein E2C01_054077 [Portunus trituberculatus]|uniref:Uncharacterized protein n=1 Tax=Portunus trituberculatus TaxID=210409 RepID=A0A5B7GM54_PORTR|nr:hypothetical protein [Portunus trituberculatus]